MQFVTQFVTQAFRYSITSWKAACVTVIFSGFQTVMLSQAG